MRQSPVTHLLIYISRSFSKTGRDTNIKNDVEKNDVNRGVFLTKSNIYVGKFFRNQWLTNFAEKLHHRYMTVSKYLEIRRSIWKEVFTCALQNYRSEKKPRKFRLVVYFPINSLFFEGEGHAFSLNSFKPLIVKRCFYAQNVKHCFRWAAEEKLS